MEALDVKLCEPTPIDTSRERKFRLLDTLTGAEERGCLVDALFQPATFEEDGRMLEVLTDLAVHALLREAVWQACVADLDEDLTEESLHLLPGMEAELFDEDSAPNPELALAAELAWNAYEELRFRTKLCLRDVLTEDDYMDVEVWRGHVRECLPDMSQDFAVTLAAILGKKVSSHLALAQMEAAIPGISERLKA